MKALTTVLCLVLVGCSTTSPVTEGIAKVTCPSDSGTHTYVWYPKDGKIWYSKDGSVNLVDKYVNIQLIIKKPYTVFAQEK
jgi:hypothetical protein